jgi:hypothetical protein
MLAMSLLGFGLLSGLDAPAVHADFVLGEPVNLRTIIPGIDPAWATPECMSCDELEIYIVSGWPDWSDVNIWVLKRASKNEEWGPPEELGPQVNSPVRDGQSRISADGLALYFSSLRPGGYGSFDIYVTTRVTKNDPWGPAVNLGPKINHSGIDRVGGISADGLDLYIESNRPGGYGDQDIYVAKRAAPADPWGDPVNLGPVVNTAYIDVPWPLPDGLTLLILSSRPGGYGGAGDIWMATRASPSDPWQAPVNLGPTFNGPEGDCRSAFITPDPPTLWRADSVWEYWQAPILPVVDFNTDGKLDLVDLVMLVERWGTADPLCDIGPFPWGDGKVDIEDLKVFTTEWEKQNPPVQPAFVRSDAVRH